ncbi:MAG: helix-turn-helix domain-containing protein [Hyphomicrobiaceae bacterium]
MTLGRKLRELREAAGLSQGKLAALVGVSRNAVSQWEADQTQPSTRRLVSVAQALGVPVDRLVSTNSEARARIIDAATRLFDRLGVPDTSIDIICAAADVADHEFHALFQSKEELLYEVLRSYNERTFADLRRVPPRYGAVDARIKQLLRMYYVHDLSHLNLVTALHSYSWGWSEERERENLRQLSEHHEIMLSLLEDAAANGEIRSGNYRAASGMIFALYTYTLRKAVFDNYDADKLVAHLEPQLMILLKGLGFGAHG